MVPTLIEQYRQQAQWRRWDDVLDLLPIAPAEAILDLGCGPGELARLLALRGARVTGIDQDRSSIDYANAQQHANCNFLQQDLRHMLLQSRDFDGLWCSFTAAYFTDLATTIEHWRTFLKPQAWICFVEMEGLLAHSPLPDSWRTCLNEFEEHSRKTGIYDFRAGARIAAILRGKGFQVVEHILEDDELSADGPLSTDVLAAWSARLDRMQMLQRHLGTAFSRFRSDLLSCLAHSSHRSGCVVRAVIARADN